MDKRILERLNSCLTVIFRCNDTTCSGTITNLSGKGICINTEESFLPCGYEIDLYIPLIKKTKKLRCKISRIVKRNDLNYTIGVELLNPPKDYLEFVDGFGNIYKS